MSDFPILDLVLGMVFIYFLLSVISSSIVEISLTILKARAKVLEEWLITVFNKEVNKPNGTTTSLGQAIIDHCAAVALSRPGVPPSYIDAKTFTTALLEKITFNANNSKSITTDFDALIEAIKNTDILSTEMQRALLGYAYEAKETYEALTLKTVSKIGYFKSKVENWYDTTQDRLTGTFKRKWVQPLTFLVAIITVVALNADSIAIAKYLYSNPEVRAKMAEQATLVTNDSTLINSLNHIQTVRKQDSLTLADIKNNINQSVQNIKAADEALNGIPLGWKQQTAAINPRIVVTKITGLLATIFAIFLGAPFWFDILNKIANLRGTGPKPPSSTGSDSNDSKGK